MEFDESELRETLKGRTIGNNLWVFAEIPSTNDWLKDFILRNDTPGGALVIADYQSRGKGRMRRNWVCPPGTGLLISLYWIPRLSIAQWPLYTMAAAMAVYDLLSKVTSDSDSVRFKWPNDIMIGGKKICGILAETATARGIVVGIGLNVLQDQTQLPDDQTTSIAAWTNRKPVRQQLLLQLLSQLEHRFSQVDQGLVEELLVEISRIGMEKGTSIKVQIGNHTLTGTYQGLSPSGTLRLQTQDGLVHELATVDKMTQIEQ